MGDEATCTSEKLQNAEDDQIINKDSDRRCAREGEPYDQQRSFMQSTRSEQLSAVSTFERKNCIDIPP